MAGIRGDGSDNSLIESALHSISDKTSFLVGERAWGERMKSGLVGPSYTVSALRKKILNASSPLHCHMLAQSAHSSKHLCKNVPGSALQHGVDLDAHAPDDLPPEAWSQVEQYLCEGI